VYYKFLSHLIVNVSVLLFLPDKQPSFPWTLDFEIIIFGKEMEQTKWTASFDQLHLSDIFRRKFTSCSTFISNPTIWCYTVILLATSISNQFKNNLKSIKYRLCREWQQHIAGTNVSASDDRAGSGCVQRAQKCIKSHMANCAALNVACSSNNVLKGHIFTLQGQRSSHVHRWHSVSVPCTRW
jgi:hypothetical protein